MAEILRRLKIPAIIAGLLSFSGATIENIVETGAEKAGHYWIDHSLRGSNDDISKRHWDRLILNLSETYNKAKIDANYRRILLVSAKSEEHRDFYVLFALSLCPLPQIDQEQLNEFRSQKPFMGSINAINSNGALDLNQVICQSFAKNPPSDEQIKSVLNAPLWNTEFWLEVFGWFFFLCAGTLQMHEKGLLGGHKPRTDHSAASG